MNKNLKDLKKLNKEKNETAQISKSLNEENKN